MSNEQEHELTPAERELEAAMRTLRPAAPGVDPIAIAFAAGAASARRSLWAWRSAAAVLCVALGVSILVRSAHPMHTAPMPKEAVIVRETSAPSIVIADAADAGGSLAYLRLRAQVLDHGIDAAMQPTHFPSAAEQPIPRAADGGNWRPL